MIEIKRFTATVSGFMKGSGARLVSISFVVTSDPPFVSFQYAWMDGMILSRGGIGSGVFELISFHRLTVDCSAS